LIDKAVSKSVGIVILNGSIGGGGSGKSLYEAACLVNSVVRDRAYLLIGERVDIATAVNASGVVLSDQGLSCFIYPLFKSSFYNFSLFFVASLN